MILSAIGRKIRSSFSDAAAQYEALSSLQKEIGRELSRKVIDNEDINRVLDIGMGTGWLTNRIGFYLPEAQIVGLDFASGMLQEAQKKWAEFTVVQADARVLPFQSKAFDMVVSNLAFQWIEELPLAFTETQRILRNKGKLYITMFGQGTFEEMFGSLQETAPQSRSQMAFRRLPDLTQVQKDMESSGFQNVQATNEIIKVHFPDLISLIRWTKEIGANVLNTNVSLGKEWLQRAGDYYQAHYKDRFGVTATFEVIWLEGERP